MTTLIGSLGLLIALSAAVRSTWSPCGRSMLSTITPIGERARGHHFSVTASWFVLGGVLGGLCLGGIGAGLAVVLGATHLSVVAVGSVAGSGALAGAAFDARFGGLHMPGHRRQVNERWLDRYRSGVYGVGFGWQIGTGLGTYLMTAGVYLVIVFGGLTGDPWWALALGTVFGTVRGLAVLLGCKIQSPAQLAAFHRRFDALGEESRQAMVLVQVASAVVVAGLLWFPAAPALALGVTALVLVALIRKRPQEVPAPGHERSQGPNLTAAPPARLARSRTR